MEFIPVVGGGAGWTVCFGVPGDVPVLSLVVCRDVPVELLNYRYYFIIFGKQQQQKKNGLEISNF